MKWGLAEAPSMACGFAICSLLGSVPRNERANIGTLFTVQISRIF